ncbi:MAG: AsmA-like C-terminal domain-containing protein, partial [Campylobacteraceae bacterium]
STSFVMNIIDDGVKFIIDDFDTNLTFANSTVFEFGALDKIYQFSELAKNNDIKDGNMLIKTDDFENFDIFFNLYNIDQLPLYHNNTKVDSINGEMKVAENLLHVKANNNTFEIIVDDKLINATMRDVDVLIDTDELSASQNGTSNSSGMFDNLGNDIHFEATNGKILLKTQNITLESAKYSIDISKNSDIFARFEEKNGNLEVKKTKKNLNVYANDFTSSFINHLIKKEFFVGGVFSTYIDGEDTEQFDGVFSFRDTKLKDLKLVNNILAFINTIPSLMTLSDPKYSSEGFPVKNGVIEFSRMENFIYIPVLYFEGYSTDIMGLGYFDINTNEIYLDLKISTLKSISGIIDAIPLLNFVILGEDGKITMSISVRGNIENPKVETSVVEGAIKSPLNVIKRVFQLPFYILQ